MTEHPSDAISARQQSAANDRAFETARASEHQSGEQHLLRASEAAQLLSQHAWAALHEQQFGSGATHNTYRRHIKDIRAVVWCALNDLGQAKRAAVRARQAAGGRK